jgi:hypothetical protein
MKHSSPATCLSSALVTGTGLVGGAGEPSLALRSYCRQVFVEIGRFDLDRDMIHAESVGPWPSPTKMDCRLGRPCKTRLGAGEWPQEERGAYPSCNW